MIYRFLRWLLLPLFRRRLARIEGEEHLPASGGFLLATNHIDYLDGFFLTAAVGQKSSRLVKFLSETNNYWWTGGTTIQVNRADKAGSLNLALAALKKGMVICVFPEGQRNTTNKLLPGKTGIARLAAWTGMPVIPAGIIGPSGKSFLASLFTLFFRRKPVTIRFGSPIVFERQTPESTSKEFLLATTTMIMEGIARVAEKSYHS